jgi:hypothetical protein
LATTIITPARIALGIFVGQHRTLRFKHGARNDVLRCDQFDLIALATKLEFDGFSDLGIAVCQRGGKEAVRQGGAGD